MKAPKFWMVVPTFIVAGVVGLSYAKLPQPPMDDAAKAKVEEAKAKAAESTKKARADEEAAMDRVVDRYKKEKGVKTTAAAAPSPAPKKK